MEMGMELGGVSGQGFGGGSPKELDSLLDDLTERVPAIRHALILSNDGLVTGASASMEREDAEHLAAVASGLHSLARGTGRQFRAGRVRQTMVEFDEGVLFVTAAGENNCLCVLGGGDADIGQIAYEMTVLVNSVGEGSGGAAPVRGGGAGARDGRAAGERAGGPVGESYPQV